MVRNTAEQTPLRRRAKPIAMHARLLLLAAAVGLAGCKRAVDQATATVACSYTGKAAADFNLFLQNYPTNQSGAMLQLTDMQNQLGAALNNSPPSDPDLYNAIQDAFNDVESLQAPVKNGVPVNTGPLSTAMQNIGNLCSIILEANVGVP